MERAVSQEGDLSRGTCRLNVFGDEASGEGANYQWEDVNLEARPKHKVPLGISHVLEHRDDLLRVLVNDVDMELEHDDDVDRVYELVVQDLRLPSEEDVVRMHLLRGRHVKVDS